jgi:FixJ family two-component response regulator
LIPFSFGLILGANLSEMRVVSVVDDNYSVRRAVATVIRSAGFTVEVFGSAEEFIRSNQISCTACLVMSVQLKGMSGLQLQSHLAAAGRHIPMVFIVASGDEKAQALAFELGAVNVLDKPSGDDNLLKEIRLILKPRDQGSSTNSRPPGS